VHTLPCPAPAAHAALLDLHDDAAPLLLRRLKGDDFERAAHWLAQPRVNKWLYFGNDRRILTPLQLRAMCASPHNVIRLICCGADLHPAGIIGVNDVSLNCRTAMIWIARTVFRREDGARLAERAGIALLAACFRHLGLASVSGWAVDCNKASLAAAHAVGFRPFGVQRACHVIGATLHGRVHFDITREDFEARHPEVPAMNVEL
jgi:RimJ/RimL family protein N-acetyltransferase